MKRLSTGQNSTLGSYLDMAVATMGDDSKAAIFLQGRVDKATNGRDEEVIADETQMIFMLSNMNKR